MAVCPRNEHTLKYSDFGTKQPDSFMHLICYHECISQQFMQNFCLYQSLGDISNPDAGILVVAGLNTPSARAFYTHYK